MSNRLNIIEKNFRLNITEGAELTTRLFAREKEVRIFTEKPQGIQGIPGEGVPTGGATGQVLAKASNSDFETQWVSPSAGSDANYIHNQVGAATTWNVTHNLGKYPSVMVVDSGNTVVYGDVNYTDENSLTVSFAYAFGGKVYVN